MFKSISCVVICSAVRACGGSGSTREPRGTSQAAQYTETVVHFHPDGTFSQAVS